MKKTIGQKKGGKDLNKHFIEKKTQVAPNQMKRCSSSLVIIKCKLKSNLSFIFHILFDMYNQVHKNIF